MDTLLQELASIVPDSQQTVRVIIRLLAAALLGAIIGYQRERLRKAAGLRTHMLVALGTAFFIIVALETGMPKDGLSRVIQGVATGIGFIGGGAILKLTEDREIRGLTTAGSLWTTAALGVAVGLGYLGIALLGVMLAWVILSVVGRIEAHIPQRQPENKNSDEQNKQ